jgi:hypothetical protein
LAIVPMTLGRADGAGVADRDLDGEEDGLGEGLDGESLVVGS